jgi:hypothetical protein
VWVEPLFGEAKDRHGSRRFRLHTLEKVNIEALLVAAGQNVKRLLTFGQRGPRRPGQVAALRRPAPNLCEFRDVRRHRNRPFRRSARVFQYPDFLAAARE